jgi:hypothetical protein
MISASARNDASPLAEAEFRCKAPGERRTRIRRVISYPLINFERPIASAGSRATQISRS